MFLKSIDSYYFLPMRQSVTRHRRSLDAAIIGVSLGLLVAFPLGIISGMRIERRQTETITGDLSGRIELAAYQSCMIELTLTENNAGAYSLLASKCKRVAKAVVRQAHHVLSPSKDKTVGKRFNGMRQ